MTNCFFLFLLHEFIFDDFFGSITISAPISGLVFRGQRTNLKLKVCNYETRHHGPIQPEFLQ
jgi:hypothetical protein